MFGFAFVVARLLVLKVVLRTVVEVVDVEVEDVIEEMVSKMHSMPSTSHFAGSYAVHSSSAEQGLPTSYI